MIAASMSPEYRRMGCRVTSFASSGVRQTSKKPCFARTAWNSVGRERCYVGMLSRWFADQAATKDSPGRYLPAWRITHTGARSVSSPALNYFSDLLSTLYKLLTSCRTQNQVVLKRRESHCVCRDARAAKEMSAKGKL